MYFFMSGIIVIVIMIIIPLSHTHHTLAHTLSLCRGNMYKISVSSHGINQHSFLMSVCCAQRSELHS